MPFLFLYRLIYSLSMLNPLEKLKVLHRVEYDQILKFTWWCMHSFCSADLRDGGATLTNLAHSVVEGYFPLVMAELQRVGWVVSHHLLGVDEWRYSWQWNTETDRKDL